MGGGGGVPECVIPPNYVKIFAASECTDIEKSTLAQAVQNKDIWGSLFEEVFVSGDGTLNYIKLFAC